MSDRVFIDTGAWFAGIAQNDQYHSDAMKHRNRLIREKARLVTTNLVLHESTMLLERKTSKRNALRFLKAILSDPVVEIVHVEPEIESEGLSLYQKYRDQDFSIVDCISFSVMKHFRLSRCFTFDHHFRSMGFSPEPS